ISVGNAVSGVPSFCTSRNATEGVPYSALAFYRDSHASGRSRNHAHGMIRVASIEVFPLFLHDLGQLGLRHLADLLFVRNAGALGDAGLDLQQSRRRRALALELE